MDSFSIFFNMNVCSHENRLIEAILMSTNNVTFSIKKRKSPLIIPNLQLCIFPRDSRASSKQPR